MSVQPLGPDAPEWGAMMKEYIAVKPSAAFEKFMSDSLAAQANEVVPGGFKPVKAEDMFRQRQARLERDMAGYRPKCSLCNRFVEGFRCERREERRTIRVMARCHGRSEEFEIDEYQLFGYTNARSLPDIINSVGFFRRDAEEASRIRQETARSVKDNNGVTVGVRYSTYSEVESLLKERQLEYGLGQEFQDEFDRYQRDVTQKIQAQEMQRLIGLVGNASSTRTGVAATPPSPEKPSKPTKAELLAMLAEYEKEERKSEPLQLNYERAISL